MLKKNPSKSVFKRHLSLFLLAVPGLLYLLVNNYLPMFGIYIAFKDIDYAKGLWGSDWVGFKNFEFLFRTSDAYIMTRNTLLYNFAFIAVGTVVSIIMAILLYELKEKLATKWFQSSILFPNLVSWVIVSYLVFAFLNSDSGLINKTVLAWFGLEEISWYAEPKYWPFILLLTYLWKTAGYTTIVYFAFISGIDNSIYEAAKIDGAGKFRQIWNVTLPLLKPAVILMVLLAIGRIFHSDFGLFYQVPLNSGTLYSTTQTIDTYVYRALMQMHDLGMSSAAGLYQSVVGFVLVVLANRLVRKVDPDNALF